MRFAVVLYGGVSLAIYINGVVQELLHLVRATAPHDPPGQHPTPIAGAADDADRYALLSSDELESTEEVYRALGQLLSWATPPGDAPPGKAAPIRTRFVVDVLSGSSAGGINGIFLAKALANEQEIEQLRDLWVDEGDIALLVNDDRSLADLDGLKRQSPPRSVLNSRRFYWKALEALDQMETTTPPAPGRSRLVDELDLWITTTDIRGLVLPIDLFDRVVYEKRHRNVLHFRYGSVRGSGSDETDFTRPNNPLLAFAARATAAFPFAFEPMRLDDIDEVIDTSRFRRYGESRAKRSEWTRFFSDYVKARRDPGSDDKDESRFYRSESFGDGGYLDNKPFTWATRSLWKRRSDLPVDRRLIYVEPDPGKPPLKLDTVEEGVRETEAPVAWSAAPKVNALDNVRAALVGLPRSEAIRDDLEAIIERNREIGRIRDLTEIVDRAANEFRSPRWFQPIPLATWRTTSAQTLYQMRGPQYVAYHRLKIAGVLDDIAELVCDLIAFEVDSDEYSAVRCLIEAWFQRRYPPEATGRRSHNEFLISFDVGYRFRRFRYLNQRIEQLLRFDGEALDFLARFSTTPGEVRKLRSEIEILLRLAKRELNEAFVDLRAHVRALHRRDDGNPLLRPLASIERKIDRADLLSLLSGAKSKEESVDRARHLLNEKPLESHLGEFAAILNETLRTPLSNASDRARDVARGVVKPMRPAANPEVSAEARRVALAPLRHIWEYYELYDSVRYPISYGGTREANHVEIIRVSPHDAPSLIDETDPNEKRRKLAGVEIHHFGGFFERAWRKNDILWGRLDGAERILETTLPAGDLREGLLRQAQLTIIKEEFATEDNEPLRAMLADALLAKGAGQERSLKLLVDDEPERLEEALNSLNDPEAILAFMKDKENGYEVRREIDRQRLLETIARSSVVTGGVLEDLSRDQGALSTPARWLTRAGRLGWFAVETATRKSLKSLLIWNWLSLLVLVSVVLILGGPLLGSSAAAKAGWTLLAVLAVFRFVLWVLDDFFARRRNWLWGVTVLAVGVVVGLAAIEVHWHLGKDADAVVKKLPDQAEDALRWVWPYDDGEGPKAGSNRAPAPEESGQKGSD